MTFYKRRFEFQPLITLIRNNTQKRQETLYTTCDDEMWRLSFSLLFESYLITVLQHAIFYLRHTWYLIFEKLLNGLTPHHCLFSSSENCRVSFEFRSGLCRHKHSRIPYVSTGGRKGGVSTIPLIRRHSFRNLRLVATFPGETPASSFRELHPVVSSCSVSATRFSVTFRM